MYCHEFPKTRKPTAEEWARIESVANWVIENAPATGIDREDGGKEKPLRDHLVTFHEFTDRLTDELTDEEIDLEHAPSNVVQKFYLAPAIRLHDFMGKAEGIFTFTSNTPLNDSDSGCTRCDTRGRPYDLLVCAILALVDHQIPGLIQLKSDGTPDDWAEAVNFASGYDPSVVIPPAIRAASPTIDRPASMDFRA